MKKWTYDEEYVCTKMYIDHYVINKENNCKEKILDDLSLKLKKSKDVISKKLGNISYMLDYLKLQTNNEIKPLKYASKQNFIILSKILFENTIYIDDKLFTNLIKKIYEKNIKKEYRKDDKPKEKELEKNTKSIKEEIMEKISPDDIDIRSFIYYGNRVDEDNIKYLKWENVVAFRAATYGAMGSPGDVSLCCSDPDGNYDIYYINPNCEKKVDDYFVKNTFKTYYEQLDKGLGANLDNGRFLAINEGMGNFSYIRAEYFNKYCEFCTKLGVRVDKEYQTGSGDYYCYATKCMLIFFNKKYEKFKNKILSLPGYFCCLDYYNYL